MSRVEIEFRRLIQIADPSIRVDRLSPAEVITEGLRLSQFAVTELAKKLDAMERADSEEDGDRLYLVRKSTLLEHGILPEEAHYDSNPRMDGSEPTRKVITWNGVRIGVTHVAGEDYRFGQRVQHDYGRIYGSYGHAGDKRSHDVIIGKNLDSPKIFAIQQLDGIKRDEVKYGIGFNTGDEFAEAYRSPMPNGMRDKLFGGVWEVDPSEFDPYRSDSEEEAIDFRQDADYYMVFFEGRNTSTVVEANSREEAIAKARAKKVAGNDQPVKSVQKATGKDLEDIQKGRWVRTRPSGQRVHGKAPKDESPSKYRPQFKKDEGVIFPGDTSWDSIVNHNSLNIEEEAAFEDFVKEQGGDRDSSLEDLRRWFSEFEYRQDSTRESCLICVEKHLGNALSLFDEVTQGYPQHRILAVGNLSQAADEAFREHPELAEKIRDMRHRFQVDDIIPTVDEVYELMAPYYTPSIGVGVREPHTQSKNDRQDESDDEEPDIADFLAERYAKETAPIFENWLLKLKQSSERVLDNPASVYKMLDEKAMQRTLFEMMMLSHLAGAESWMNEVRTDSAERLDGPKSPEWLKFPFKKAIAYLQRKVNIPTDSYKKMEEGYHDWAFSIAKMTKGSLLQDAKWVIQNGMEQGLSHDEMRRQWNRLIGRKGWRPGGNENRRIYTIIDTNIRSAHSSGRAQQMYEPDNLKVAPYAIWRWRDSPMPRPHHQALHNKAIPLESSFFQKVTVPAGFGCRCSVFAVSKGYCDRNGIEILSNPPDPTTISDPGFRYPLRGLNDEQRREIINTTLSTLDPEIRKAVEGDL